MIICSGLYFIIEFTISGETDEQLTNITKIALQELQNNNYVNFPPYVEISKVTNNEGVYNRFDNVHLNTIDEENEPFREYISFENVNGDQYKIVSRISLLEKEDLILSIFGVSLLTIFLFVLILYILNKTISQSILKDFYNTLDKLKVFSIKNKNEFKLNNSQIVEFEELNRSIILLTTQAQLDYQNLKEFTEELNHEIQTPIAIIKSKIENILQNNSLSKEVLIGIEAANRNLYKLERINKAILLLNKLENKKLFEISEIFLAKEIRNVVENYSEILESKNISVKLQLNDKFTIKANVSLINILLSNLVSNAIKHNNLNGSITVTLNEGKLAFSNTGNKPEVDTNRYFARFYKESNSAESVGLGLTIVKKICDQNNISIDYYFNNNLHQLTLLF
jgi:signal transduction histidine kinase